MGAYLLHHCGTAAFVCGEGSQNEYTVPTIQSINDFFFWEQRSHHQGGGVHEGRSLMLQKLDMDSQNEPTAPWVTSVQGEKEVLSKVIHWAVDYPSKVRYRCDKGYMFNYVCSAED